jgi:hypothetical protein
MFKNLILKHLIPVIESNNQNYQFSFHTNHSTIYQINRLVDILIEKKKKSSSGFLYMAWAFNKIWHPSLLFKLKTIFRPYYFILFNLYIEHRHFIVQAESVLSEISLIYAEVPQSIVTAPLLTNLYTSDQPTTNHLITGDFADDKAI